MNGWWIAVLCLLFYFVGFCTASILCAAGSDCDFDDR